MLASKYAADPEASADEDGTTNDTSGEPKPLLQLSGNEEKFDWADEPLEVPSKLQKKSRSGTVGSQQGSPPSEKRHVRKKSTIPAPEAASPATPTSSSSRKKKQSTTEPPLIDLPESPKQNAPVSLKKMSRSQKRADVASQLHTLAPPKPDPSSQLKPSTPDLVQRTLTPASAMASPSRKVTSKRGKSCIIRVPKEDEDKDRRRNPLSQRDYLYRIQKFEDQGCSTRGFDQAQSNDSESHVDIIHSQNCEVFPDPAEETEEKKRGRDRSRFEIIIPDKRKWDQYMNEMMENKLKALGVKPAGEERKSTPAPLIEEEQSRRGSATFPGLANSPPLLSSSVNSQHQWQAGVPFSAPPFSPAAFTSNTSVGALGSPGPSQPSIGRPGHVSRQSTFGLPLSPNVRATSGVDQGFQQTVPPQPVTSNVNMLSQTVTPLPGGIQRIPSRLSRASSDIFNLDRSQTQTPRVQTNTMRANSSFGSLRRETLLSEQSSGKGANMSPQGSQQGQGVTTPEEPFRVRQNTYGELAYPTPCGHRHNISQNLEREAENAEYYPGEYVNEGDSNGHNESQNESHPGPTLAGSRTASGTGMPGHRPTPSHASKASSSGFNVDAKEFKFEPKAGHAKSTSNAKNSFVPTNTGVAGGTKAAVPLLTAHANGDTTGGGNFNAAAPVFKPPEQSSFNFSATKPDPKVELPKEDVKPKETGPKIFSGINVTDEIVKPVKKSKAIPIVNPDATQSRKKVENEYQDDESGRLGQNKDRFKRSKLTMLDGGNEPKFDLPKELSTSNKLDISITLPKLDDRIDDRDSDLEDGGKEPWHDFAMESSKREELKHSKADVPPRGPYVPPHKRQNTVQDGETDNASQKPAVVEASEKLAKEANRERQLSPVKTPRYSPALLSPTYQEIDAIMENLNGEPDFGAQRDLNNDLPAPVKSPMKKDYVNGDGSDLHEPKLNTLQTNPTPHSPAVSSEWLRDQQRSIRDSVSPVRKLVVTKDVQISDWDDMLDPEDETKIVPHAQFFDTRIKSLIEGILQQQLGPLQKALKEVDTYVKTASNKVHGAVATTTEKTNSDADDEDDADDTKSAHHARRSDKKLEQIRNIINEAIKPLATGNTALPDASEVRAMIDDGLKSLDRKDTDSVSAEQIRLIVSEVLSSSDAGNRGTLDLEQLKLVVAESIKAYGPPPAPNFDSERIRSLVIDAVKSSTPKPLPPAEFDPEHMQLVVAETIKAFGVASSSMDPEQIRSVVTEAIKASAPSFDLEHMKLVVAETVKALGTPSTTIDVERIRPVVTEAVKASVLSSEPAFDPEHMKVVVAETIKAIGTPLASIDNDQMRSIMTDAVKASTSTESTFDPEQMKIMISEAVKASDNPVASIDPEHMRLAVSEAFKAARPNHDQSFDPEHMQLVVAETVKAVSGTTIAYDPEEVRSIVTEVFKSSSTPAFDPDEIRAIVKEVVNFSKAGESGQLEPEHFRSIVTEAISASGIAQAIESLREASVRDASTKTERFESEIRLRTDAEQKAKDLAKELELSEKEIGLLKESSANTESSIQSLRDERQKSFEHITKLERAERELGITLSSKKDHVTALEGTLDEYRVNSERLRDDLDKENKRCDELQGTVKKLRENLQYAAKRHSTEHEASRVKEEEAAKEVADISARLDEEKRVRQRVESDLETMAKHEREVIIATVQLDETRASNERLHAEIQKLREENLAAQNDVAMREREAIEAKTITRSEVERNKKLLETGLQVAERKYDGLRTELETRLKHVREELEATKENGKQQRANFDRRLEESNQARTVAVREAADDSNKAHNKERHHLERKIDDLSRENDRAMQRALDDQQRSESHFRGMIKIRDEKVQFLEDKCKFLEDRVTVAQSAAEAAATAAQQNQKERDQPREALRPSERFSPQALRESIAVLQEQLQERERRIDSLKSEQKNAAEVDQKLKARDTEISWLRELLGVRIDELNGLVTQLSSEGYDLIAARDAAVRIRTNLQMEQQEKERFIERSNTSAGQVAINGRGASGVAEQGREMLRDVSNFATPRAAQIAAAWSNWTRGQPSPRLNSFRDAPANPSATPSRHENRTSSLSSTSTAASEKPFSNNTTAQTFLSGLMTPPASNYVRRTPTPSSTVRTGKAKERERVPSFSADGRELDAQPLSLSLEEELEAAGDGASTVSPQASPTKTRPPRIRAPTPGVSVLEGEDPLRTPLTLEDPSNGGIGDGEEIAKDSVVEPLGEDED